MFKINLFSVSKGLLVSCFLSSTLGAVQPQQRKPLFPNLIIKTVKNLSPYDLQMVDRFSKNTVALLPAGETVVVNFASSGLNKVVIMGNMVDTMEKKAQYVFKKLDDRGKPEPKQEVYLNIGFGQGGENDGGGIIVGEPGSIVCKFFSAGKNGGCRMTSRPLRNVHCKTVEYDLVLQASKTSIEENIFRLSIGDESREIA